MKGASRSGEIERLLAALQAGPDLLRVLELLAEESLAEIGAASLSISVWEREEDRLRTLVNVGDLAPWEERRPADETYPVADYPAVRAMIAQGNTYAFAEGDPMEPREAELLARLGKASQAGTPIRVAGVIWGELWATTRPGDPPLRTAALRRLEWLAAHIGQAIAGSLELSEQLRAAHVDPLTGVGNRRAFEEAFARLSGSPRGLTLLLVDVDGLKLVNDSRGHVTGDACLRAVADALRDAAAAVAGADIGRLGGDEFAVLLPAVGDAPARVLAESAERAAGERMGIGFSWGVVGVRRGEELAEALAAADRELYLAKTSRRLRPDAADRRRYRARGRAEAEALLEAIDEAIHRAASGGSRGVPLSELRRIRELAEELGLDGREDREGRG